MVLQDLGEIGIEIRVDSFKFSIHLIERKTVFLNMIEIEPDADGSRKDPHQILNDIGIVLRRDEIVLADKHRKLLFKRTIPLQKPERLLTQLRIRFT